MRNVDHSRTTDLLAAGRLAASLCGALILASLSASPAAARSSESAYCQSLRAQIAQAGGGERSYGGSARQRAELQRMQAYANSLGCDRGQFLFFGGGAPAQCGALQSRIARISVNLANLQQGDASRGGARSALLARYEAECRHGNGAPQRAEPANIFEALFGARFGRDPGASASRDQPLVEGAGGVILGPGDPGYGEEENRAHAGAEAICVRSCDGGFFPVSYSAHRGNIEELNALCRAQCPNAEATIYTKSLWRDVETAVSIDGEPYMDHPNALKFQKQRVPACSCKPPGVSWAAALQDAERMLAFEHHRDSIVTADEAERLSRPLPMGGASRRVSNAQSARRDARLLDAASAPVKEPAAAAGADQGVYREVIGPDGTTKRVRVIAPAL